MKRVTKAYQKIAEFVNSTTKKALIRVRNLHGSIPRKRVVKLSLVLLGAIYLLLAVSAARPGEVLFFPKLFVEDIMLSATHDPEFRQEILLKQLSDRSYAYKQSMNKEDCVKGLLAEGEVWRKMGQLYQIQEAIWKPEDLARSYGRQYQLLKELISIGNECESDLSHDAIANVMWLSSVDTQVDLEVWGREFNSLRDSLVQEIDEVTNIIRETEFRDQGRLSAISELLILSQEKVMQSPLGDGFDRLIGLLTATKAVEGMRYRLEENYGVWHPYRVNNFRLESRLLCKVATYATSPRCGQLNSIWNSVEGFQNVAEQLEQGGAQFVLLYDELMR